MFFETFDTTQVGQTLFCVLKELKTPKPVCFWDVRTRNNLFFKFLKIAIIRIFDIYPSFSINFWSIFDHFSLYRGILWDLSKIHEIVSKNCIEIIHLESIRPKKNLLFELKQLRIVL